MQERETRKPLQKRSIAKKKAIMITAKEMFLEKGYLSTNTNEIAEKAGISVGTLYSYFKDKRDIFLCIMDECNLEFREVSRKIYDELFDSNDPKETIEYVFNMMLSALSVYGSLHGEYINHVAKSVDEMRNFFAEQNKEIIQFIKHLLHTWDEKLLVKDKEVAALMFFELGCTIADTISSKRSAIPDEVLKREMVDMFHRHLFHK